jgi:hypothetical protein
MDAALHKIEIRILSIAAKFASARAERTIDCEIAKANPLRCGRGSSKLPNEAK